MGLFSSKKKTYVSSAVYNMAGDENERPQVLKTLVLGSMIGNRNFNLVSTLQRGYMAGNGMKLRQFYNWSTSHYPAVGIPKDYITGTRELSIPGVEQAVAQAAGKPVKLDWVEINNADATYWAMKWMYLNLPDRVEDEWTADADLSFDEFGDPQYVVMINFEDGVTAPISLIAENYTPYAKFIYARYQADTGPINEPVVTGPIIDIGGAAFPVMTDWTLFSSVLIGSTKRLNKVVTTTATFSDGRPAEVTTETSGTNEPYDTYKGVYLRKTYQGIGADGRATSVQEYATHTQDRGVSVVRSTVVTGETLPGGVTKTITTVTDQDTLQIVRTTQLNTQLLIHASWGSPQIFIYRHGSGYASLDAMITGRTVGEGYFPMIPVRLNNEFISKTNKPVLYEQSVKAYKKALGGKFDELVDKLKDNESLGDIDFAYVVFGVSLNTKEEASRKYLYNYFERFMRRQYTSAGDYTAWTGGGYGGYVDRHDEWASWFAQQQEVSDEGGVQVPNIGGGGYTEPSRGTYSTPPVTSARINTTDKDINFDMEIDWQSITETKGAGLAKPGAKNGECWIVYSGSNLHPFIERLFPSFQDLESSEIKIFWQLSQNSWKCLSIRGLVHKNHIWNGKYVEITAKDALQDDEESGFLVPLHADVYKSMSLVDATQMSTACAYIVLNCYQIVKKKWYQRGWFKVFLIVLVVVLTIIYPPLGAATGAGILGPAATVGAALGFSGLVAIIVGTIANMIAAMILTRLITYVSVQILGEEWGQIIGAIASFVAIGIGTGLQSGQTMASMWGSLMSAPNLMQLTNVLGSGVTNMLTGSANDYMVKTQELMEDYAKQSKELSDRYAAEFGYGSNIFNPMDLTEASTIFSESEATFLSRTLMTGSDVAEMSMDMITNFSDLTLDVDIKR